MANMLIASASLVFRRKNGKLYWLIVNQGEEGKEDWGLPKTTARKGESSVRAVIRYVNEFGGLDGQVLEEVARTGGTTMVGGRIVPLRTLFYLLVEKTEKPLNFTGYDWFESTKAQNKIKSKKDQRMIKLSVELLKNLEKEKGKDYWLVVE